MLVAASIACVFLISAINVLVLGGKFFEIADSQALKAERSIIYYETFTKIASKRFMPKQYKSITPDLWKNLTLRCPFQAIDVPRSARLGAPNSWVPSLINLDLSTVPGIMFIIGSHIRFADLRHHPPLIIVAVSNKRVLLEGKSVYLKPVYVNRYKYGQDRGSGWDKGDLFPLDERTFNELFQEKKNGNVSRIYLVVK
jgi:hypothetical protein